MEEMKLQWHPAFCSAMELIFEQDREHLKFEREYNLNRKPLEVDLLIIKKPAGYEVKDEIGRIFREHNIFEYKSPDDAMNIDTFYKVNAYAVLYKASGEHVDEIRTENVAITLIRETKPEKLLEDIKQEGFTVRSPYKGIYYIGGKAYFPTQIVVSKELSGKRHVWLQALSRQMSRAKVEELIRQAQGQMSEGIRDLADSVFSVSIKANQSMFDRVKEDAVMCEALKELMADEIEESRIMGEKRGEKKGLKALIDVLKEMGIDFESAYKSIVKTDAYAGMSREQVRKYW